VPTEEEGSLQLIEAIMQATATARLNIDTAMIEPCMDN